VTIAIRGCRGLGGSRALTCYSLNHPKSRYKHHHKVFCNPDGILHSRGQALTNQPETATCMQTHSSWDIMTALAATPIFPCSYFVQRPRAESRSKKAFGAIDETVRYDRISKGNSDLYIVLVHLYGSRRHDSTCHCINDQYCDTPLLKGESAQDSVGNKYKLSCYQHAKI